MSMMQSGLLFGALDILAFVHWGHFPVWSVGVYSIPQMDLGTKTAGLDVVVIQWLCAPKMFWVLPKSIIIVQNLFGSEEIFK